MTITLRSWEALAAVTAANISSVAVQAGSADGEKDNSHLSTTTLQIDYARQQANKLHQHAGTCASLALTSAAITWQATKDWWCYRKLRRLNDMETWLLRRRLFFIRSPVLLTALLSLGAVDYYLGGVRIFYWPEVL